MKRMTAMGILLVGLLAWMRSPARALAGDGIAASVPIFTQVATYIGPAPPTQSLHLVVHLAYPNPGQVAQFIQAVNDPSSPTYGSYLNPSQFTTMFGPSGNSYSTVEYTMTNAGATIFATLSNLKTIDVIATVAEADSLFNTTINQYVYNSVTYYANGNPASVPKTLKGIVMAVSGFTNFAQKIAQPPGSNSIGFGPQQIEFAYNEPIRTRPSLDGAGTTMAIDTACDYLDSDLIGYWKAFGVKDTGTITRVPVVDPVNQGLGPCAGDETTLDVEQATSNAPAASVEVYEGADALNSTFDDVYAQTANDPNVDIVTTSFGSCEAGADPNEVAADNDLFEQGAAEGQTWFAADGDNGSTDCGLNDPPFGFPGHPNPTTVDFPASSPYVTGAGGTTLKLRKSGKIASEVAWSGSGGGLSAFFGLPWYQQNVPNLGSSKVRNVPDVALDADPSTPYALYYLGTFAMSTGGTSAVAPNLAAMQAQFDQYFAQRLGLAQTGLYNGFRRDTYPGKAWHDITSGSNGGYNAHAGYDNVTGTGSLDALRYMEQIPKPKGGRRL